MALEMLATVLESPESTMANDSSVGDVDLVAAAYLLSAISNVLGNNTVEPAVSEVR